MPASVRRRRDPDRPAPHTARSPVRALARTLLLAAGMIFLAQPRPTPADEGSPRPGVGAVPADTPPHKSPAGKPGDKTAPAKPGEAPAEKPAPSKPAATPVFPNPPPDPQKQTVRLPGRVAAVVPGGGGRCLAFHVPTAGQVVVHDLVRGKTAATIEDAGDGTLVAAGRDKLFTAKVGDGKITRWDLATGKREETSTREWAHPLKHLAIGSAADGPLLVATHDGARGEFGPIDPVTFRDIRRPVEDSNSTFPRSIPYPYAGDKSGIVPSADGRAFASRNTYLVRDGHGYRGGTAAIGLPITPATDGRTFLSRDLLSDRGKPIQSPGPRPGIGRRLLPAAAGPFYVAVEQERDPKGRFGSVKLTLHKNGETKSLGTLPGSEELTEWAGREPQMWIGRADRHLFFAPEPGVVVFHPPGADHVHLFPVDLADLLDRAGAAPEFTSTPPAEAVRGRGYEYQATAVARGGKPTFRLAAGPPGMAVTPEGRLTWSPTDSFTGPSADVRLVARDAGGREAVQSFQLLVSDVPPPAPVAVAPKNPPPPRANPTRPPKKPADPVAVAPPPTPKEPPAAKAPDTPPVAPAADDAARTVKLPGTVGAVAVGGGGRFIVLHLPQLRQVAVFDAKEAKVVKYLPVAGDGVLVAAGAEKLFVVLKDQKVVQRWDLKTFEKEVTAPLPVEDSVHAALMGSASHGPLWLVGAGRSGPGGLTAVDPQTLRSTELRSPDQGFRGVETGYGVRVSADGRTLGYWGKSGSPSGFMTATLTGDTLKGAWEHTSVGHVTPGPDGRVVYTAVGRFTTDGHPIGLRDGVDGYAPKGVAYCFPAAEGGSLYLNITLVNYQGIARPKDPKPRLSVHLADGRKLTDLAAVDVPAGVNVFDREAIGYDQRYMLVPSAGLLVALPPTNDRLLLYRFDLDAALAEAGGNHLLVESPPPAPATRGRTFTHALQIKSTRGGIAVKLAGEPEGMKAAPDGKITWDVPADFADKEVTVIVTVSDNLGEEVVHSVRIPVVGERVAVAAPKRPPAAPKDPPAVKTPDTPPAEPADDTPRTVKLPGSVGAVAVGGGGRFIVLHLPQLRQLAVFDAKEAKVVKYLPVAEDTAFIAAGQDHLFVALPTARVLQRWNLRTLEREATVPQPIDGTVAGLCMGSASKGPLLISPKGDQWGTKPVLVDPIRLKPLPGGDQLPAAAAPFVRASADGRVFGWRESTGSEGHSMSLVEVVDGKPKARTFGAGTSLLLPSPDGRYVYCGEGVFTNEFKRIFPPNGGGRLDRPFLPAASGNLFMQLEPAAAGRFPGDPSAPTTGKGRVSFFLPGQFRAFAWMDDVEGLAGEAYSYGGVPDPVMHDRRVHLLPEYGLLVTIPTTNDRLVVRRFDLDALLEKSGVDYLVVTSEPPAEAVRGRLFEYAPAVRSKKGGAVKLESGPDGMRMAGGKLTWAVPADFADKEADVILAVTDATGQELFQTFKLAVRDPRPGERAPKARPAADPPPKVDPPAPPPKVDSPADAAEPPGDLTLRPARLDADEQTVKLPSAVGHVAVAAGGRLLILHLPKERKLAVFDTAAARVVKYLPVAEDGALFAAGRDRLVVLLPSANVVQRWDLKTLEKELTVANPIAAPVKSLAMGSDSDGPLVVVTRSDPSKFDMTGVLLYDPRTFKPSQFTFEEGGRGATSFHPQYPPEVRVSANGELITAWVWGVSPSGVYLWARQGKTYKAFHEHDSWGVLLPAADGRTVFAGGRILTADGKAAGQPARSSAYLPAVQGPLFLSVDGAGDGRGRVKPRLSVHLDRDTRPLVTLPELAGLDVPADRFASRGRGLDERVFLIPDAKLLVVVPEAGDKLVLHRFDLDALLENSGVDYLFVTGRPPAEVARGERFEYAPVVRSKKGGVKVKLETGPDGMRLTAGGKLTWAVPEDFADKEADVILSVTDATGQEVFHTFKLAVRDR